MTFKLTNDDKLNSFVPISGEVGWAFLRSSVPKNDK